MSPFLQVPSLSGPSHLVAPTLTAPQLTHAAYYNQTWSSNVTRTGFTYTWNGISSIPTDGAGKRLFLYLFTYRALSSKMNTSSNAATWYGANTMTIGGNSMTFVGYTASAFNGTGAWIYKGDLTGNIAFANSFPSNGGGEYASSLFVLDYVSDYKESFQGYYSNTYNSYYSSYLNLAPGTLSGGTHALRVAMGVLSNSDINPQYLKGGSEPTYVSLGSGDNGTDERNSTAYSFETNASPVNMTGRFYTSDNATSGISGAGLLIKLKNV